MKRREARDLSRRGGERLDASIVLASNEHLWLSAPLTHKIIGGSVDMQLFRAQRISHGFRIHAKIIL